MLSLKGFADEVRKFVLRAQEALLDPDRILQEAGEAGLPGWRDLAGFYRRYLDVLDAAWPPDKEAPITFVVIPEYVARHWWERILYNQAAKRVRTLLLGRPHTVVVQVPYRREEPAMFEGTTEDRDRDMTTGGQAPASGPRR